MQSTKVTGGLFRFLDEFVLKKARITGNSK